jgi:hypothetical protein
MPDRKVVIMKIKEPMLLKNLLSPEDFQVLQDHVKSIDKSTTRFYDGYNRYEWTDTPELKAVHEKLLPIARQYFESETLLPSFNFASWYFGDASLEHHTDINACTYSIDLAVYATQDWDLYVEGTPYTLKENDALLYYGENQEHWREPLVNPDNNVVCNVFFFYVEPDHWFHTVDKKEHHDIRVKNSIGTVQDLLRKAKLKNGN